MKKWISALLFFCLICLFSALKAQSDETITDADKCSGGGLANLNCAYWNVTYKVTYALGLPSVEVTCQTGGKFVCQEPSDEP